MLGYRYSALVVDDEDPIRKLTVRSLERRGFVCTEAGDGVEASRLLATHKFHVLVTDLRMPNGNGYSLAVDQLEQAERPLIVILTGVLEPRLAQDLLRRGIDDIMFKPVNFEMFAGKVVGLVERRTSRDDEAGDRPASGAPHNGRTPDPTELSSSEAKAVCDIKSANFAADMPTDLGLAAQAEEGVLPQANANTAATRDAARAPADTQVERPQASVGKAACPQLASEPHRPGPLAEAIIRAVATLDRLSSAKLAWLAVTGLLMFSAWLWLEVQVLRQTSRAISVLEELGARIKVEDNGAATVSFRPGQRPGGLASLAGVPNLRRVNLGQTRATDEDLQALAGLRNLEDLDLQETEVTDAGLAHLTELHNLRQLSLRGTRVTDAGLQQLKRLEALRALSLLDTEVSADAARELKRGMPSLEIEHASVAPVSPGQ